MDKLPEQGPPYPYASMGHDIETMCRNFLGYGEDVVIPSGFRITANSQAELSMHFLKTLQKVYGAWSLNEIAAFCCVMNETVVGNQVGVKEIAAELGLSSSTASHVILKLEQKKALESYPCNDDRRRKWLRLHQEVVAFRMNQQSSIWDSQRALLERVMIDDN